MSSALRQIVIVGTGQAADSAVMALRSGGFEGHVTLIGEDRFRPYQRPPLTKAYMTGEMPEERLYFRASHWYHDACVELLLESRAVRIDTSMRRVSLESGDGIDYDVLILATGSRPRRLEVPGAESENVFDLRTLQDAQRIRRALADCENLLVVGAGYIGLEAAASARQLGLNVTVLEYDSRVLSRVTSPRLSTFFENEHRARGVDIRTHARLRRLVADHGRVCGAELEDGSVLPADVVLVGVGIRPNEQLATEAGIPCDDGILVDQDARTSISNVFAAGDCTRRPLVPYNRLARLESVQNAVEQGKLAAAAILGKPGPHRDCPWFWSDQYDLKLQIAGISQDHDDMVVRGNPDDRRFAVFYFRESKLISTDAINMPQEFMFSKKLIVAGASPDPALLAATSIPLKHIARKL